MSIDDFSTATYLEEIKHQILINSKSFSDEKDAELRLSKICTDAIEKTTYSLTNHIIEYDRYPYWTRFLIEIKPDFDYKENFVEDCFSVIAIIEIIIKEVKIVGILSSAMPGIIDSFSAIKELFNSHPKNDYYSILANYNDVLRFSILYWRALEDFEASNERTVAAEFENVSSKHEEISDDLDKKIGFYDVKTKELSLSLEAMEKKAGFLLLYAGFDKYATAIRKRLFRLEVEKYLWFLGIFLAIISVFFIKTNISNVDWFDLLPIGGVILFFSTLLKVNLKKIDQYEQIMSKVEHKLAVSTFYQKELSKIEGKGKEVVNEEYYKFLFSQIETTEWNTPDLASDISNILSSYKK